MRVPKREPLKPKTTSTLVQRTATVTAQRRTLKAVLYHHTHSL